MTLRSAVATAALLAPVVSAPGARAQDVCDLMTLRPGETSSKTTFGAGGCYLKIDLGGLSSVDIHLTRHEASGSRACESVAREKEMRGKDPRVRFAAFDDFSGRHGERGFEMRSPHWVERGGEESSIMPGLVGGSDVKDSGPARFVLNWCRPPFEFDGSVLYYGKDGEHVPASVIEDLRDRARTTAARLAGTDPRPEPLTDDEAERMLRMAIGPEKERVEEFYEDPRFGGWEAYMRNYRLARQSARATYGEDSPLTPWAVLSAMNDRHGRPVFPSLRDKKVFQVLARLAELGSSDPSALVALNRFGMLLVRMDIHGRDSGPDTPPPVP